jgi:hypothetical protein
MNLPRFLHCTLALPKRIGPTRHRGTSVAASEPAGRRRAGPRGWERLLSGGCWHGDEFGAPHPDGRQRPDAPVVSACVARVPIHAPVRGRSDPGESRPAPSGRCSAAILYITQRHRYPERCLGCATGRQHWNAGQLAGTIAQSSYTLVASRAATQRSCAA